MSIRPNSSAYVIALAASAFACSGAQAPQSAGLSVGGSAVGSTPAGAPPAGAGGNPTSGGGGGGGGDQAGVIPGGAGSGPLPMQVPSRSPPGSCGLASPAFCEDFEKKAPGGRAGDMDETHWAFARWSHLGGQFFVRKPATTETNRSISSVFCGKPFADLLMPADVQICDGVGVDGLISAQLNEVFDDLGDFGINSFRSRQLFDFTGRTGTVMFDVDAKVNPRASGHGWWIEFWITADPEPLPYHEAPTVVSYPKNGLGINFVGDNDCPQGREATSVQRVFVMKDYKIVHEFSAGDLDHKTNNDRCVKTQDQKLNRFKILVSKDKLEVWGSHHDDAKNLHLMASTSNLDLSFTRGYIHLQHSQYNAPKDGNVTGVQTYRWDNIGFDGPSYAPTRAFSVPDNAEAIGEPGIMFGYHIDERRPTELTIPGVELKDATKASLDLNTFTWGPRTVEYTLNGGPPHTFAVPDFGRDGVRCNAVPLELSELVNGDNRLTLRMTTPQSQGLPEYVGNIDLSLDTIQ